METRIYPTYSSLCKQVADLIIHYVQTKPQSLICLASGHTPVGVFEELARRQQAREVDFSACTFLSLDEWIGIDPKDPGSCLSMLQRDCFGPLQLKPRQLVYFDVTVPDLEKECTRINTLIASNNGLDIMLVGVGTNGHIGMNEPGTSFDSVAHLSELAEETKTVGQKYFEKTTPLSHGITLGLKHLREARMPLVMASGEKKAAIVAQALQGTATETIPLSVVHLITQGYILLDEAAASQLKV